ncbi:MAG: RIP metalloprotease RseP [Acidobacteriales bacterium 59-55]|nr:MAG: RIP metalloprotease RseP [Acidobacteriales bacterium 59-55]
MSTVIQLAIVLGIMVLVHELGHFIVAKLCKVRVEVFSIGFGTRLFGFKRGDTDYRLSLLPLGGYVKMSGEMPGEAKSDDPGELENHPRWQRVLIALAGPFANFLLAIALMTGVYMVHNEVQAYIHGPAHVDYVSANTPAARTGIHSGDTIVHYDTIENPTWDQVAIRSLLNLNQTIPFSYVHDGQRTNTKLFVEAKGGAENFALDTLGLIPVMQEAPVQVASLEPNMPATRAGLEPGDKVVAIDGLHLHYVPALLAYMQDQAGKPSTLTVERNGKTIPIKITPELADVGDGTKDYRLGFSALPPPVTVQRLPFGKAAVASWEFNKKGSMLIVEVLKRMFTRQVSVRSLSGPIGIGQQIHQAVSMPGWMPLVGLMAYISLNLGIFNLLPIPILDGGMILFLIIESIIRRDVNQQIKERVYQIAFVCLLVFATFVIFNDITKLSIFSKLKP